MAEQYDLRNFDFTPYLGWLGFIQNPVYDTLRLMPNKIVLFVSGNRYGKTFSMCRLAMENGVLGTNPIPRRNIMPDTPVKYRTIRIGAELLPEDKEHEVRSTAYPMLKSMMPSTFIIKDITARSPVVTTRPIKGGKPIMYEFVSYGQAAQAQAGVDRWMIFVDEVCPYAFYEESMPRLLTTNGQFIAGATPVEAGWMYTELYERAKYICRTECVRAFLKKQYGQTHPKMERTDSKADIGVIQAATDDNPIWQVRVDKKKEEIKAGIIKKADFPYDTVSEFIDAGYMYDDMDTIAMRRYGIFRQITGAVHKEFQWNTHVIEEGKYFPTGIPEPWKFARMIDFHTSVPWAITWIALSPEDEAFVWEEMNPDPHDWTTNAICKEIAKRSLHYKYRINLIDKLSTDKQVITNTSCQEDMNKYFREWGRLAYDKDTPWESWEDKSTKGQDKVRERLINAKICGKPFNNSQMIHGVKERLPTLWIFDKCRNMALSLKSWKQEEWLSRESIVTKDPKDKTEVKWSHFNKTLEAVMMDSRFRAGRREYSTEAREQVMAGRYFKGARQ